MSKNGVHAESTDALLASTDEIYDTMCDLNVVIRRLEDQLTKHKKLKEQTNG